MARQKKWSSESDRKRAYRAQREAAVSLSIRDKMHAQSWTSTDELSRFDSIRTPIIERPGALERYPPSLLDSSSERIAFRRRPSARQDERMSETVILAEEPQWVNVVHWLPLTEEARFPELFTQGRALAA